MVSMVHSNVNIAFVPGALTVAGAVILNSIKCWKHKPGALPTD